MNSVRPEYFGVMKMRFIAGNTFANVEDNPTQDGPFWHSKIWAQKAA